MDPENDTIELAAAGDLQAFERVVNHYSAAIVRYVRNMVGDQHAAEDVAQRVFLNLYRSFEQFDKTRGSFNAWIYRIARNAALNHLRDSRQHQELTTEMDHHSSSHDCPAQTAELREQFALLDDAVHRLPEAQRSAWVLAELEGLTQAEIAEIEGVPEGTVKSRISRARETLLNALRNEIGMER